MSSNSRTIARRLFSSSFPPVNDIARDSFLDRFALAWACFFRVLFSPQASARVRAVFAQVPSPALAPPPPAPVAVSDSAAIRLLSLLQREGRLIDFLQQDVTSFSDSDVGAAARVVHDGCQRALRTHFAIEPVRTEEEGSRVTVDEGYDADRIRLVGDVRGQPPYTGVLRHGGWRAARIALPQAVGVHDETVVAAAEVEIG